MHGTFSITRVRASRLSVVLAFAILTACRDQRDPGLIVASGHVEATEIRISTKVGGRLERFPIEEGNRVLAGQELARIDTTDLLLAVAGAEAERSQAKAELDLRLAGARKEDIAEMEAQVDSARADLEGAQKDLDRMQGLLEKGSGTTKARDDALTKRDVIAARLDGSRQALRRLRSGSRPEEIESARASAEAAAARLAQLQQQVRDATVTSPASGIVTEKIAEQGELLTAGSPLAVLTDLDDAWLTVYVGEPDLARVRLGQEAEVVTDDGQARKGTVTFVSSQAEFTPKNVQTRDERVKLVFKMKIALDNKDGLFKPGMPAEAKLRAAGSGVAKTL